MIRKNSKNTGERSIDTAREKFNEYSHKTTNYIRKNPFKSLAIAAGAGVLIGLALRRKPRKSSRYSFDLGMK